jgi:hypothetical protein
MRASPRAVPIPLEAGSSAACTSGELKSISAGSVAANALLLNEFGSRQAATRSRSSSGIDSGGAAVRSTSGSFYSIRLTRLRSLEGSPMKKSRPRGAAISSAKKRPGVRPDTRRITSPTSQPQVLP